MADTHSEGDHGPVVRYLLDTGPECRVHAGKRPLLDVARVGAPLQLVLTAVTTTGIAFFWRL